jgi:hypothetical protein
VLPFIAYLLFFFLKSQSGNTSLFMTTFKETEFQNKKRRKVIFCFHIFLKSQSVNTSLIIPTIFKETEFHKNGNKYHNCPVFKFGSNSGLQQYVQYHSISPIHLLHTLSYQKHIYIHTKRPLVQNIFYFKIHSILTNKNHCIVNTIHSQLFL